MREMSDKRSRKQVGRRWPKCFAKEETGTQVKVYNPYPKPVAKEERCQLAAVKEAARLIAPTFEDGVKGLEADGLDQVAVDAAAEGLLLVLGRREAGQGENLCPLKELVPQSRVGRRW